VSFYHSYQGSKAQSNAYFETSLYDPDGRMATLAARSFFRSAFDLALAAKLSLSP
jgi:hypothetical protein